MVSFRLDPNAIYRHGSPGPNGFVDGEDDDDRPSPFLQGDRRLLLLMDRIDKVVDLVAVARRQAAGIRACRRVRLLAWEHVVRLVAFTVAPIAGSMLARSGAVKVREAVVVNGC